MGRASPEVAAAQLSGILPGAHRGFQKQVVPHLAPCVARALSAFARTITDSSESHRDPRAEITAFIGSDPDRAVQRARELCREQPRDASIASVVQTLSAALFSTPGMGQPLFRLRVSSAFLPSLDHRWHQDSVDAFDTARADRSVALSAWVPLHDVAEDEGCLELVPGSHGAPQPHGVPRDAHRTIDDRDLVGMPRRRVGARAGEVVVLDPWLVHRTAPNTSRLARVAVVVWYAGPNP